MTMTRRELLYAGTAGAAALVLGERTGMVARREKPYGPFRMGIQSYSLRGYNFDTALDMTQKEGLHYWEAFQSHIPYTSETDKVADALAKARAHDIKIVAWGVEGFDSNEAHARSRFDFAKQLGLETITADPSSEALPILDKLVDEYKINIAIHNHGPGARYSTIASVANAIRDHHPRIGACVDTGHYLRSGEDPVEAVKTFGSRTFDVHLKDVKNHTQFTEIGQGDLRTVELFRLLHHLKYRGLVMLEYEEHAENVGPYIDLCLSATRDAIAKAMNQ